MEIMEIDPVFWSGKKVFVTGHTGFKGGWLTHWLKKMGANVTGYALAPETEPALFNIADISKDIKSNISDIRDFNELVKALSQSKPEIVFHLAAQPLVRDSYERPEETFSVNVMGTLNLFEAIKKNDSVKIVINVTTDKCYENKEWLWRYRENEPLGGHDPYSASKACSEILSACYRKSYFQDSLLLATARAGNVIGGGDWSKDRLIPDLVRGYMANEKPIVRNPFAIRPWQHVLDALDGYLCLAQHLYGVDGDNFAEAWNFGPDYDSEIEVKLIVEQLSDIWGEGFKYEYQPVHNDPHEATSLKLDNTKARIQLGWKPKWNIKQVLIETAEWYQEYIHNKTGISDFMNQQIDKHQK
jgi:CDP-glucose 4,6-dehydratase